MIDKTNGDKHESDHFKRWKNKKTNQSQNGRIKNFFSEKANYLLFYGGMVGSVYLNMNPEVFSDDRMRNNFTTIKK